MARKHPLPLSREVRHARFSLFFLRLQQRDLLVGVHVESLGREAGEEGAREGESGGGRVGVEGYVGPEVLVVEVVGDLEGEVVVGG